MNIVGVIPARAGSKGIPGKNTALLGGKPLLNWSLDLADQLNCLSHTYLLTDMPEALKIAQSHFPKINTSVCRPSSMSDDDVSMERLISYFLDELTKRNIKPDALALLQPTTPFRRVSDIELALEVFAEKKLETLTAVCNVWQHPDDMCYNSGGCMQPILGRQRSHRRQDFRKVLFVSGALYIFTADYFLSRKKFVDEKTYLFQLDEYTLIDIDEPYQMQWANALVNSFLKS